MRHRILTCFLFFLLAIPVLFDNLLANNIPLGKIVLRNVTKAVGLSKVTPTFGAAAFDADGDQLPDLLVSNHGTPPSIYINQKTKFRSVEQSLLNLRASDRHTPVLADFDNDGDQDLYFLHGAKSGTGTGPNEFYVNQGIGKPFVRVKNGVIADPKGRGRTAIWFDYDADGLLDLYVVNQYRKDAPNRLYHNAGNRKFQDVSSGSGLKLHLYVERSGAIAADFDNDSDLDIFLTSLERPFLLMNQGNGKFLDETEQRGIPLVTENWAAAVGDYNEDGFLDIYLTRGHEMPLEGALMTKERLNFMHQVSAGADATDFLTFFSDSQTFLSFEFYESVFTKFVDRNNIFVGSSGKNSGKAKFTVGPGFLSADGRPPQWDKNGSQKGTFIWRDPVNNLWTIAAASGQEQNFNSGGLVQASKPTMTRLLKEGMEKPSFVPLPNLLLENRNGIFHDVTSETGTGETGNSRGACWVDLDNDADLDLFVVNAGYNGYGKQPNALYVNQQGRFQRYSLPIKADEKLGRGDSVVSADFNNDGLVDLFLINGFGALPNSRGPYQFFQNETKVSNRWIRFTLIGGGQGYTNRDAIGAKIKLESTGRPGTAAWQFITGGSGSNGQSYRDVHFGLGQVNEINVTVFWPPGKVFPLGHQTKLQFTASQFNQQYLIYEVAK